MPHSEAGSDLTPLTIKHTVPLVLDVLVTVSPVVAFGADTQTFCRCDREATKPQARSAFVRPSRSRTNPAIMSRQPCTARNAASGSARPMPRTTSGIPAPWSLETRVVKHRVCAVATQHRALCTNARHPTQRISYERRNSNPRPAERQH